MNNGLLIGLGAGVVALVVGVSIAMSNWWP